MEGWYCNLTAAVGEGTVNLEVQPCEFRSQSEQRPINTESKITAQPQGGGGILHLMG